MTFRLANVSGRAALVSGDHYFDVESLSGGVLDPDPMGVISRCADLHRLGSQLDGHTPTGRLADVELGPPVPSPGNCFGIGLNYAEHVAETGRDLPAAPVVFTKFPSCVVGATSDVVLDCDSADYEAELVVVIGEGGRNIAAADAWSRVAGVTGGQDISDRALQFAASPAQFSLGKSRDTYGPMGPLLVSPDVFDDPDDIGLRCSVNGEERQSSSTRHLILSVSRLVEYLSSILTLSAGDVIFTGTPEGVGGPSGRFLADGDVIVTEVAGVGTMTNRCVRGVS